MIFWSRKIHVVVRQITGSTVGRGWARVNANNHAEHRSYSQTVFPPHVLKLKHMFSENFFDIWNLYQPLTNEFFFWHPARNPYQDRTRSQNQGTSAKNQPWSGRPTVPPNNIWSENLLCHPRMAGLRRVSPCTASHASEMNIAAYGMIRRYLRQCISLHGLIVIPIIQLAPYRCSFGNPVTYGVSPSAPSVQ